MHITEIKHRLEKVFEESQAGVLSEVIFAAYTDLVKISDFSELKEIVKELAEAQKRTGFKIEELAEAQKRTGFKIEELAEAQKRTESRMEELAEAQKRTESRMEELAEAQKRTESRMEELAEAQKRTEHELQLFAVGLRETRGELGGLSRSFGYALENEAYRMLPKLLKNRYGIELQERLIRTEIGGKEINLFGKGRKNGKEVLIVGETKARLDEKRRGRAEVFAELEKKVEVVSKEYEGGEILKIFITHYATRNFLDLAKERGVIVVQSFEWD